MGGALKHVLLPIIAALSAAANAAQAQPDAQSVEGAERFLAIQFDRGIPLTSRTASGRPFSISQRITRSRAWEHGRRRGCAIGFVVDWDDRTHVGSEGGIVWDSVASVQQAGDTVVTRYVSGGEPWDAIYHFTSPELAARAAYAMEFLRQACDPARDTGF